MNNYSELSDFEINVCVARILFNLTDTIKTIGENSIQIIHLIDGDEHMTPAVDYCKNPADSWKLMVDNGIELHPRHIRTGKHDYVPAWGAVKDQNYEIFSENESPGRAVAICFLMIKGGEV